MLLRKATSSTFRRARKNYQIGRVIEDVASSQKNRAHFNEVELMAMTAQAESQHIQVRSAEEVRAVISQVRHRDF
jgi:hypothetical protein